jgi:hypothetical protein
MAVAIQALSSALAGDPVTNNATLNLLKASFTNRTCVVTTNRYRVSMMWISRTYAQHCQRPLDLYLPSSEVGGFVNPVGAQPWPRRDTEGVLLLRALSDELIGFLKGEGLPAEEVLLLPGYEDYGDIPQEEP